MLLSVLHQYMKLLVSKVSNFISRDLETLNFPGIETFSILVANLRCTLCAAWVLREFSDAVWNKHVLYTCPFDIKKCLFGQYVVLLKKEKIPTRGLIENFNHITNEKGYNIKIGP